MDVYIKDMEMPKPGVYMCELGVLDDNTAVLTIYTPINEPQKSYTLIPAQPHGRLIEKNAVFKLIQSMPSVDKLLPVEFMKALQEIPTVIPAEEDE